MDIKKLDRTALKSYFVKNAIPTAGNFADLIDGLINQKEDGIAKPAGEPLSVQADGDATSQKKAINFYKNFADPNPAWTLSLNPWGDPNKPETAKLGWSIGDAAGNSKLFIDQTTGNVGVGTVDPGAYKLNVNGPALFTGNYLFVNSENAGRLRVGAAWGMPGLYSSDDGAKPLTLGVPAGQKVYLGVSTADAFVEGGTGNSYFKGNVGIGTNTPRAKLEVRGGAIMPAVGNSAAAGIQFPSDPGGGSGDVAWIRYYPRQGEACTLELGVSNDADDHIALMPSGNVGIGTRTPNAKLEVNGDIHAGSFKQISDAREKQDVADLDYGLREIMQLHPVSFNWKEMPNPHKSIGLIGQEVKPIIGEAVYQDGPERDGRLSIAYTSLIPVLINAVKELAGRVEQLSGRVAA